MKKTGSEKKNLFMPLLSLFLFSVAVLIVPGGCSLLHDEEITAPDMPLKELVHRMEDATDPYGHYRHSKTFIMKQRQEFEQNGTKVVYMVKMMFKAPNLSKTVVSLNNVPVMTTLYDGKNAWTISENGIQREKGEYLQYIKVTTEMLDPAKTILDVFPKIGYCEVKDGTKSYYKLTCRTDVKEFGPLIIYVNKNNFLTKKTFVELNFKGIDTKIESIVDKYDLYNGVMIASESTNITNGVKRDSHVVDYQLNAPIPDSEFEPPDAWYNGKYKNPPTKLKD